MKGSLALLLATVIWGSAFVAQSVGMDYIGPFTFQATRCFAAVLALLPLIYFLDRGKDDGKTFLSRWKDKTLWKAGILCGIPLFLAVNLQQIGLVDTDAGKSGFLTAMYIVIVPILGLFLRKKPSKMVPISVVLAVAGLYCLSVVESSSISISDLSLLGCAFMFAVQILIVDHYAPHIDAFRLNLIQALVSSLLSAVFMFIWEEPTLKSIGDCWLPICYTGVLSMGLSYSLQIVGQKNLEPTVASLIMSMESVFAVLTGWIILGDVLTTWETVGCILVFIAVILPQLPERKKAFSKK